MPCDTQFLAQQTIAQRKEEIKKAIERLSKGLLDGKYQVKVGPKGGVVFVGFEGADRSRITDACAYRRIMVTGNSLVKAKIAQAEALAGRAVDKQALAHGVHSHDGGASWHDHKG